MLDIVSAIIIAIVQGITEWLPISSSGHLVLAERLLSFKGGLLFDVALHFGTLMAVFVYFGKDITDILEDWLKGNWKSDNSKMGFLVLIATIPAGIAGFLLLKLFESAFESLSLTAMGFAVTSLVLFIASFDFGRQRKVKDLGIVKALGIGIAQIFSLFPGVSRSGTTISAGLWFGLKEKDAMKFSFLMSIPIIFGANLVSVGSQTLNPELIWATLTAFVVGLGAIHLLYTRILLDKKNLKWFGLYALVLALGLGIYLLI